MCGAWHSRPLQPFQAQHSASSAVSDRFFLFIFYPVTLLPTSFLSFARDFSCSAVLWLTGPVIVKMRSDTDTEKPETPSGLMRLLIWPIDAILFIILLPVIIIQSLASLTVAVVYIILAKRRERAEQRRDNAGDQGRFRSMDTFLRCCGKLDSVRRSIGVFPRYGS